MQGVPDTPRLANAITHSRQVTCSQRLSVCLSLTDTRAPGLSEAPGCLCSAPGMDLLVRALDCGVLGWAGIHAPGSKDSGRSGLRDVAGPCGVASHKYVFGHHELCSPASPSLWMGWRQHGQSGAPLIHTPTSGPTAVLCTPATPSGMSAPWSGALAWLLSPLSPGKLGIRPMPQTQGERVRGQGDGGAGPQGSPRPQGPMCSQEGVWVGMRKPSSKWVLGITGTTHLDRPLSVGSRPWVMRKGCCMVHQQQPWILGGRPWPQLLPDLQWPWLSPLCPSVPHPTASSLASLPHMSLSATWPSFPLFIHLLNQGGGHSEMLPAECWPPGGDLYEGTLPPSSV